MTKKSKAIQEDLQKSAQQIWFAGLGALAMAEQEGTKVFKALVQKGESYEVPGVRQVEKGVEAVRKSVKSAQSKAEDQLGRQFGRFENGWEKVEDRIDQAVAATFQRMGVPSRDEVKRLTRRIEQLTSKVDGMKSAGAKSKAVAAAKRTAKKVSRKTTGKAAAGKAS